MLTKTAKIEIDKDGDLTIRPDSNETGFPEGLVVHGYGGNKEEMLGLAYHVVVQAGVCLRLFDLPGHAPDKNDLLTRATAAVAVQKRLEGPRRPSFFIGHSLGARLGLEAGLDTGVAISLPGPALFEGSRRDLLRTLRTRRVREPEPFSGLTDILNGPLTPSRGTLLLYAADDIKSVSDAAGEWGGAIDRIEKIPGAGHLDIISHPQTWRTICDWLG